MYTYKTNRYSSHNQILDMIQPQSTILDVGCGDGIIGQYLKKKQCNITGIDNIDIDEHATGSMDSFIYRDLDTQTPLEVKGTFDYVIAADVLEHLRFSQARLYDLKSCLRTDSYLIASTGNIALWVYRLSLLLGRFNYTDKGILDRTHVHLYTVSSFKKFIEHCGYEIMEVKYTPIPFEQVIKTSKFVDIITNTYHTLARIYPSLFAYQVIVKARVKNV